MRTKGGAFDPRLLEHARGARGYLAVTVGLGLATTALVLAQKTWGSPNPVATARSPVSR